MKFVRCLLVVVFGMAGVLSPSVVSAAGGGGGDFVESKPADPDYTGGVKAVEAKNWSQAIELLMRAMARDDKNADIFNYLGYAERHRGNMDQAFKHYAKALSLDPKHRGAHEYVGEAYLLTGNLAKAEEHLAALDKLCFFSCSEFRDLKAKIAEHRQKKN